MDYLPLFFSCKGRQVLLVGGGSIAYRKASLLIRSGAMITVVAPKVSDDLRVLVEAQQGRVFKESYSKPFLNDMMLVIAATNQESVNQQVSIDAQGLNIPVNVVDQPSLCSFIFPSIIDRSPIVIAVSSGGSSPVLARLLRSKIEATVPAAYGLLATWMAKFRQQVKQTLNSTDERRYFWESILEGPTAEMVLSGKTDVADQLFEKLLSDQKQQQKTGEVYLVGAGPGDPDLLTFKALRLMQRADIVLYDRLVSEQIINLTRADAERIYVGKKRDKHTLPQAEINQLLVHYAKQGKRVLRLKGGDPFIFGRGGEEIELLAEEHIPFQVVPGITAASGCSSYAGIPLTHRDYAQSVRFVTAHLKDGSSDLPWQEFVPSQQTIVFYMGLKGLPVIASQLIAHGKSPDTPIALIEHGTLPTQKVYIGSLATITEDIANKVIHAPTLIIVGEVVSLHKQLNWYATSNL